MALVGKMGTKSGIFRWHYIVFSRKYSYVFNFLRISLFSFTEFY